MAGMVVAHLMISGRTEHGRVGKQWLRQTAELQQRQSKSVQPALRRDGAIKQASCCQSGCPVDGDIMPHCTPCPRRADR